MPDEMFVDGVLGVGFCQGAMRIDLFTFSNVTEGSKKETMRLIMTKEGFVEVYAQLTEVMRQLDKIGSSGASSAELATKAGQGGGKMSPNF